jgi:hypothetical protein
VQSRKTNISPQDIWEVVKVDEYLERSKLGHTKGYELLSSGKVKSVRIDGKRLVLIQSWYDYLERLLEEQSTFRPGRHPTRRPRQSDAEPGAAEMPSPRPRGRPPKFRPPNGDGPVPAVSAASSSAELEPDKSEFVHARGAPPG